MTQDEIDLMKALPRIAELEKKVASLEEAIESLKGNSGRPKEPLSTAEFMADPGAPVAPSVQDNIQPPVEDERVPEPTVEEPVSDPSSGPESPAAE